MADDPSLDDPSLSDSSPEAAVPFESAAPESQRSSSAEPSETAELSSISTDAVELESSVEPSSEISDRASSVDSASQPQSEGISGEASNATPAVASVPPAPAAPKPAKAKSSKKKTKSPAATATSAMDPANISLDPTIEPIKVVKAKGSKNVSQGVAHIQASFNNTIISITNRVGDVIGWSSAGKCGFKGSRKSTAYAAQIVAQDACKQAMGHGLKEVEVWIKGPGAGRESAVRALQAMGLDIVEICDITPIPHNGCRPKKQRRV